MSTKKNLLVALGSLIWGLLPASAGEFPDSWTWDNKPEQRAGHAALEGKPMLPLEVTGWINGEVKPADLKGTIAAGEMRGDEVVGEVLRHERRSAARRL